MEHVFAFKFTNDKNREPYVTKSLHKTREGAEAAMRRHAGHTKDWPEYEKTVSRKVEKEEIFD